MDTIKETNITKYPCKRGKVRDVYDLGDDRIVIVTTDRISAFDHVLPNPIPMRGIILNKITKWWMYEYLQLDYHTAIGELPKEFKSFADRCMLQWKTTPFKVEAIVRGYLSGSGWKDYKKTGKICGHPLPEGMQENMAFPETIFTPSTKSDAHDENISMTEFCKLTNSPDDPVAARPSDFIVKQSIALYEEAAEYAFKKGIIIADTKFEWGRDKNGKIVLIDEVLTPDNCRFWNIADYRLGSSPPSYDKQFVRDYLESTGWDKNSAPPELPWEVIERTTDKYLEAYHRLTGNKL